MSFLYTLPTAGRTRLAIYDVSGSCVRTVFDALRGPGKQSVSWDGRTGDRRRVAAGVYFARLVVGEKLQTCKLVAVR